MRNYTGGAEAVQRRETCQGPFCKRTKRETVSARDLRTKRDEDKVKGNACDVEARIELIAQSNNRRPYGYKTQATVT